MATAVAIDSVRDRLAEAVRRFLNVSDTADVIRTARLQRALEESERKRDIALIEFVDSVISGVLSEPPRDEVLHRMFDLLCESLRLALPHSEVWDVPRHYASQIRTLMVAHPDLQDRLPDDLADAVYVVRIPPLAYLRSMCNLFWSAIRHPLSDTTIDLSTGRVLYRT